MINTIVDFAFPDKNVFSPEEELFKDQIFLHTGLKVRQTLFVNGGMSQYQLYVWADLPDATVCEYQSDEKYFISAYLRCFGLNPDEHSDSVLNLLDFRKGLVGYSYGHSIVNVVKKIREKFGITNLNTYLDYSELCFVIAVDPTLYEHLKAHESDIREICFEALREFDFYGILTSSDLRLRILSKSEKHNLNTLYMTNFGVTGDGTQP